MVEMRNGKKVLITPVSAEDLKDIKVGDIVYLDGSMTPAVMLHTEDWWKKEENFL